MSTLTRAKIALALIGLGLFGVGARLELSALRWTGLGFVVVAWLLTGPIFKFSDTWQLVINTATTVITFLMVFLIQNTQNRESRAVQVKLDELIRAVEGAHNALLDLEELTDDELMRIREQYIDLAHRARANLKKGIKDTGQVEIKARRSP